MVYVTRYCDYVLPTLHDWQARGLRCALLTLIGTTGSTPRPLGSQMAVCETGEAVGMITGGCAEAALITDALSAIERGRNHVDIYGEGSPYKDITLPCGSGLRVYFDVLIEPQTISRLIEQREKRQSVGLFIDPISHISGIVDQVTTLSSHNRAESFIRPYRPEGRVIIAGHGPMVSALVHLVLQSEMRPVVYSPDEQIRAELADIIEVNPLRSGGDVKAHRLDSSEALVLLFHDHGLEADILREALLSDAFYIAALGSPRTHKKRCETLADLGVPPDELNRLHGPAGLDIGARSPPEIALSIMAQLVSYWRQGFQ